MSVHTFEVTDYCKTSSTSRTKSPNLDVSCLALQLSLPNPLKPGVKLRMGDAQTTSELSAILLPTKPTKVRFILQVLR